MCLTSTRDVASTNPASSTLNAEYSELKSMLLSFDLSGSDEEVSSTTPIGEGEVGIDPPTSRYKKIPVLSSLDTLVGPTRRDQLLYTPISRGGADNRNVFAETKNTVDFNEYRSPKSDKLLQREQRRKAGAAVYS